MKGTLAVKGTGLPPFCGREIQVDIIGGTGWSAVGGFG